MIRAILIHKVGAGDGEHTREELETALRDRGHEPRYVPMESIETVDLAAEAANLVVVAGGDGTVSTLLPRLRRLGLPVALMPLGTANNVATSLGIADPYDALASDAVTGPFDLGLCRVDGVERLFSEAAGLGAMAAMLRVEEDGASGGDKIERGRRSLADVLGEAEPFVLRLETDDGATEGAFLAVEMLNTRIAGPSLTLAPDADSGDGLLDVLCIRADDRVAFVEWIQSDHKSPAPGLRSRTSRLRFEWDGRTDFRIDDHLVEESSEPVTVAIALTGRPLQVRRPLSR